MIAKAYIEQRSGGLYIASTRASLASVVYRFKEGASPEGILQSFPALETLENVYGAIAYYLANEPEVEAYLRSQEQAWEAFRSAADPPPPSIADGLSGAWR
jgi:uncharacterized protein (DUF433 family)